MQKKCLLEKNSVGGKTAFVSFFSLSGFLCQGLCPYFFNIEPLSTLQCLALIHFQMLTTKGISQHVCDLHDLNNAV